MIERNGYESTAKSITATALIRLKLTASLPQRTSLGIYLTNEEGALHLEDVFDRDNGRYRASMMTVIIGRISSGTVSVFRSHTCRSSLRGAAPLLRNSLGKAIFITPATASYVTCGPFLTWLLECLLPAGLSSAVLRRDAVSRQFAVRNDPNEITITPRRIPEDRGAKGKPGRHEPERRLINQND